jgi:hypothetical protein
VSKKHAEIEAESVDASFFIKDLNSCNKTKINNVRIQFLYFTVNLFIYTVYKFNFNFRLNYDHTLLIKSKMEIN